MGNVDNLIRSGISTVLLLPSVPRQFREGSDDQGTGRRQSPNLGLPVLMASFTGTCRPFQSPGVLAMSSPTNFRGRPRGPLLGARAGVALSSPQVHLRYTTLISLGSNLDGMGRWLVLDEPGFRTTGESCTLASFKLKAEIIFDTF